MARNHYDVSAKKEWQKRNTLAIMGFLGLALTYSLRFNLSIAIVAMVDHNNDHEDWNISNNSSNSSTMLASDKQQNSTDREDICPALIVASNNMTALKELSTQGYNDNLTKFRWNEKDQGLVLGSFFFGYLATQVVGGFIAQRYGGKWVISVGLLCTGLLAMIFPWAAIYGGMECVVLVRVLQGLTEGVIFPAFTVLLAKWTAPDERAGLATMCFSGMPFGTALTMIISGHLISTFGWPAVFYAPGILSVLWFGAWTFLVYSSPNEHPSISKTELDHIENSIQDKYGESDGEAVTFSEIPWKKIFCSIPFWAILLSHFPNTWGHNTLKAEGPKYLHSVLHFNIHENAYVAATPYFCQWIFCNLVTRVSDHLISKKVLSVSAARRLCNTIGQAGTALAYLSLILADCNPTLAIICFMLCGSLNGAVYGGFIINPIDISPNYAGILEGVINAISNLAGFGAPYVAGLILNSNPTIQGWHYVFLIPAIGDFFGNLIFVFFCSTEVQPWNNKKRKDLENNNAN